MSITDSSNYSMANSIVVQDHDIYLAGKELQGTFMQGSPVALYWKNGSETPVQDPSNSGGWTNSVFISQKMTAGQTIATQQGIFRYLKLSNGSSVIGHREQEVGISKT